ncbi:hypothetical protein LMF89_22500 [Pelosinus sp. Bkl1]|uniref:Transmembrane protein n=2 Tax=Pelosinus baikalensis TaxID=2892015 RepID=A0ABS8HY58_9FIRM|nr:hypothetical protein [Pelosinus baikalensis]
MRKLRDTDILNKDNIDEEPEMPEEREETKKSISIWKILSLIIYIGLGAIVGPFTFCIFPERSTFLFIVELVYFSLVGLYFWGLVELICTDFDK